MHARCFRLLGAFLICFAGSRSPATAAISGTAAAAGIQTIGTTDYPNGGIVQTGMFTGFAREDSATCAIVSPDGERAWIGLGRSPGGIVEVDFGAQDDRLQRVRAMDLNPGEPPIVGAAIDPAGQYGYFLAAHALSADGVARLVRVDLSTLERAGHADFPAGEEASCMAADSAGAFAYVGLRSSPGQIVRINLATLEREDVLTLPIADSNLFSAAIDAPGEFAYFLAAGAGTRIIKVQLSNFSRVNSDVIDATGSGAPGFALDPAGAFAYVTTGGATGKFLRVNLNSLGSVEEAALPAELGPLGGICLNAAGSLALGYGQDWRIYTVDLATLQATARFYVPTYFPFRMSVVRLPRTPERVLAYSSTDPVWVEEIGFTASAGSAVVLEGGERQFEALTLDPDGEFCVLAGTGSFPVMTAVDAQTLERLVGGGFPSYAGKAMTNVSATVDNQWVLAFGRLLDSETSGFIQSTFAYGVGGSSVSGETFGDGALSLAFSPFNHRLYYSLTGPDFEPVVRFATAAHFAGQTDLFNFGSNQSILHLTPNPGGPDFHFALNPNGQVGRFNEGSLSFSLAVGSLASVLRNPATGEIVAATEGAQSTVYGYDPVSLVSGRSADLTALAGVGASQMTRGAGDPFGRFAIYGAEPDLLVRHDMQDFQKAAALPVHEKPAALALDPDGARLFAYYTASNSLGRYQLTPRGRIEGTRFHLLNSAEATAVSFYSHAAVGPRRADVATPDDPLAYYFRTGLYDRVRNRIWFGTAQFHDELVEFDPVAGEIVRIVYLGRFGAADFACAAADPAGDYGYFGMDMTPGRVVRLDLSTGSFAGDRVLETGENGVVAAAIDPAGEFGYFAVRTSPAKILKFRLSDFTRVGELSLATGEENVSDLAIDPAGQFMYAPFTPGGFSLAGAVAKIRLDTFSRVGALGTSAQSAGQAEIGPDGGYLYVSGRTLGLLGFPSPPGVVDRYRLSDFTAAGTVTLNAGETGAYALAMDPDGEFLLVGCNSYPARVAKLDLAAFARVNSGPLRPNTETSIFSMFLDSAGERAYLGLYTYPGRIVTYEHDPKPLRLAIYEDFGAFFVLKWQSGRLRVPTANEWLLPLISEGTPSSLSLDPGDYLLAWQFDADEYGPSHAEGNAGDGVRVIFPHSEFPGSITQTDFNPTRAAALPESSGWVETSSRWSAYLSYEIQNSAEKGWERLE